MTKIPLATADYRRHVPREADVLLRNRYIEINPVLNTVKTQAAVYTGSAQSGPAYISRPGLRFWQIIGAGPIRAIFSQPGTFNDDLFVVSADKLYRVNRTTGAPTLLFTGLAGTGTHATVRMAATGDVGIVTPHLWIADGVTLRYYTADMGGSVNDVAMPDGVGVIDVAVINSYVIVIPAQGAGINGRFYWVKPAAVIVDALDFATAERSADPVYQVVVFNDQFWLPGQSTTEVWFMSGDDNAPVQRQEGVVFDRGTISGTAIQIKDFMVMFDNDGGVFKIQGGETRISTPDIAERLRKAINAQNILAP